jgi:hypothetical protein
MTTSPTPSVESRPSTPSSSISFDCLPPELVGDIFSKISTAERAHSASLASLCLVNKTFLSLARPLLYRDLSIKLGTKGGQAWPYDFKLCHLVISSFDHSKLVKNLDLFLGDFVDQDFLDFADLLSSLDHLESLKLSEGRYCRGSFSGRIADLVSLHRPDLQTLNLRGFTLSGSEACRALTDLSTLSRLTLSLIPPFEALESSSPLSHLRLDQLEIVSPLGGFAFRQTFHPSFDTLRDLTIFLDVTLEPFDLSELKHLDRLALKSGNASKETIAKGPLQDVLSTARDLPIRTLSLSIQADPISSDLFDFFPKTIETLEITEFGSPNLDWSTLFIPAPRPYPRLRFLALPTLSGLATSLSTSCTLEENNEFAFFGILDPGLEYGIELRWIGTTSTGVGRMRRLLRDHEEER